MPCSAQTYTATYNVVSTPAPLAFVQVNAATPQTNQSAVSVTYTSAQIAGDTNILAIGWNNATSNITSVTDSAGNTYQLAVPTARGNGISQAIYYAKNIKAAAAGTNTVTVTFNTATPFVDIRALEYSGLDPVNPFDVGTSASGNGTSANSGTVTTTAAERADLRGRHDGRCLLGGGDKLYQPHHYRPGRGYRRGSVRHDDRKLQRHRIAQRLRSVGHAGRDLQRHNCCTTGCDPTQLSSRRRRAVSPRAESRRFLTAGRGMRARRTKASAV